MDWFLSLRAWDAVSENDKAELSILAHHDLRLGASSLASVEECDPVTVSRPTKKNGLHL
jgi:hypothetical protein